MAPNSGHRMGGRSARKAQRAAALPDNMKPVHPGQESGNFKPLKEDDLPKIHEAVLEVLETIGMDKAIPSCIEACTAVGCTVSAEGRLLFPRSVVKDGIAKAGRDITFFGASPEHDLHLSGKKVHFGTAGAAVHILDPISRKYRESNLADLFDIARICDTLEHIHFFQRSIVCRDLEDVREMDLNTCYASIAGTKKHVGTSFSFPENVDEALQMLHLIAGSEEAWRERPFVSMSVCHVVPPLKFAEDASAMSHPIRPEEVIEMNNFYTVTVYDKGAEVIRMFHTLLGPDGFRRGMDEYFKRHDGQAVTCDDFISAMQSATDLDLTQFARWYSQSGTPVISVEHKIQNDDNDDVIHTFTLSQHTPPTSDQSEKESLYIPVNIEIIDDEGNTYTDNESMIQNGMVILNAPSMSFTVNAENASLTPVVLGNFSLAGAEKITQHHRRKCRKCFINACGVG